jgi:hypothetical protein
MSKLIFSGNCNSSSIKTSRHSGETKDKHVNLYDLNPDFISSLHERIQLSARAGVVFWNDFPGGEFNRNVLAISFPTLSKDIFARLIEESLKASLETEEGKVGSFSVAFEPPNPDEFSSHYKFERDVDFTSVNLTKLARALDSNRFHIGVWFRPANRATTGSANDLVIWGFRSRVLWFLTVNFVSPGKISLSCFSDADTSFRCVISLAQIGFVNPFAPDSNPIKNWLSEAQILTSIHKSADFNRLFARMFQEGLGGTVLLVGDDNQWKRSIETPVLYESASYIHGYAFVSIEEKYSAIREYEARLRSEMSTQDLEQLKYRFLFAVSRGTVDGLFNLTRIDGATILSRDFKALAFGAKIIGGHNIESIAQTEPFENSSINQIDFAKWNVGTRHKSAARFVSEQKNCIALVASEDHKISLFSWNDKLNLVQQITSFEIMVID